MSLQQQNWIDVRTRAVFIEFSLYNANVNLFASVTLLVEYLSTGGAVPSFNIKVRRHCSEYQGVGLALLNEYVMYSVMTIKYIHLKHLYFMIINF